MPHEEFFQFINKVFEPIDNAIGPSKMKYKPGCDEDKEMFLECVLSTDCYKQSKNFKRCAQEDVTPECKAIRYDYYMCKRSMIFWNKAFSQDDPRKVWPMLEFDCGNKNIIISRVVFNGYKT